MVKMPVVSVELPDDHLAVQSRSQSALSFSCVSECVPGSEPKRVQFDMFEQDPAYFRCRPGGEVACEVFLAENRLAHQLANALSKVATLLTRAPLRLVGVPDITDVRKILAISNFDKLFDIN